jgi:hypothetical protein
MRHCSFRRLLAVVALFFTLVVARPARAAPPDDAEDIALDFGRRARSWLDIGGFLRSQSLYSTKELGVRAQLGLAWDAPSVGNSRRDGAVIRATAAGGVAAYPDGAVAPIIALPVTPRVARAAVNAAFRAARLFTEDAMEGLATRARWSGLVPELRLRVGRQWDESARADLLPTADALKTTDAAQANLWLEARAIFRLDRLVFADEELATFRLRLEQSEIAQRIALRVVTGLAAWQRSWVEARAAPSGSVAALEAALQLSEIEAALDVLTGGWFASWRAKEVR